MLRNIKELEGYAIRTDGMMGHVKDFYFDDKTWVVRSSSSSPEFGPKSVDLADRHRAELADKTPASFSLPGASQERDIPTSRYHDSTEMQLLRVLRLPLVLGRCRPLG